MHKHTAASSSTSPESTGQHSCTAGSPTTAWTKPPRRSTQAPSLSVSIGQVVAFAGGDGAHGVSLGGVSTGGTVTGGNSGKLGTVTGGTGSTGGRVTGGRVMGGRVTGGNGTTVVGGLTVGGWGLWQEPQSGSMVAEEMESMEIVRRRNKVVDEDSMIQSEDVIGAKDCTSSAVFYRASQVRTTFFIICIVYMIENC